MEPDQEYDEGLRAFVSERERIARSEARKWQNGFLAAFLVLLVFAAANNLGDGPMADISNKLFPFAFSDEPIGFALAFWLVSGLAFAVMAYCRSRELYQVNLADWLASEFRPSEDELIGIGDLAGGPSGNRRTDLRRQLYGSYEHILAKAFLEEEYLDYHGPQPQRDRGRAVRGSMRSIAAFLAGGRWIALDPRKVEEPVPRYHFEALFWPHALWRSFCLGLFWAGLGAWLVTLVTGPYQLSNFFLLVAGAFFVLYFVQFATFWGRIEKVSSGIQTGTPREAPYTCPRCQAEVPIGQDCRECGQPIDWGAITPANPPP